MPGTVDTGGTWGVRGGGSPEEQAGSPLTPPWAEVLMLCAHRCGAVGAFLFVDGVNDLWDVLRPVEPCPLSHSPCPGGSLPWPFWVLSSKLHQSQAARSSMTHCPLSLRQRLVHGLLLFLPQVSLEVKLVKWQNVPLGGGSLRWKLFCQQLKGQERTGTGWHRVSTTRSFSPY